MKTPDKTLVINIFHKARVKIQKYTSMVNVPLSSQRVLKHASL